MNPPSTPQQSNIQIDKMRESPHIWGDTDYSEIEDVDIDETKIFWMGTSANLADTPQEQLENRLAMQEQVKNGIIDEFGLPTGFTYDELNIPKQKQEEIKAAKAARAAQLAKLPVQSAPQYQKQPEVKKVYRNKYERKMDRQKMRDESKRQEKLARANEQIRQHQRQSIPNNLPVLDTSVSSNKEPVSTIANLNVKFV